jgi:hypothetical protein
VLEQVKIKRERSLPVRPPCVEKTSRLLSRDLVASGVKCGTMWEPSHECQLAEATSSSQGFRWFTRKPLDSLVDPQSHDRRTKDRGTTTSDRSDR